MIDDQADVRAMIGMVLRVNHFEVVEGASAAAGMFEASEFDAVIVDVFLEEINGFDVIGLMRERIPDLPVVAISGMTALEFKGFARCRQHGLPAEPFRPGELLRAIEAARGIAAAAAG